MLYTIPNMPAAGGTNVSRPHPIISITEVTLLNVADQQRLLVASAREMRALVEVWLVLLRCRSRVQVPRGLLLSVCDKAITLLIHTIDKQ
jgi:hypothetical protein